MESEEIWRLVGKKLSGEASPEDLQRLDFLLASGAADTLPLHVIEDLWKTNHYKPSENEKHLESRWSKLQAQLDEDNTISKETSAASTSGSRSFYIKILSLAASILVIGCISLYIWKASDLQGPRLNEVFAPHRGISKIILPDGTKVWLNSGSKLTYSTDFGKKDREVSLTGEAFFDVIKDSDHPFYVHTESMKLKVLGTAFNIKAYKNEKTTEASLIRGKIKVILPKDKGREIILNPSEKLTVVNSRMVKSPNVSDKAEVADREPVIALSYLRKEPAGLLPSEALWVENTLSFDGETMEDLAKRLERWYDVNVSVENEGIKGLKFTGRFKDESLDEVMRALQVTVAFHFTIRDKQVIIY